MDWTIRAVHTAEELTHAFDLLGAQLSTPRTHYDRAFVDLARRFPEDRHLMLVADHNQDHSVIGGAFAFRAGGIDSPVGDCATLRLLAVVEPYRGCGVGRRLVESLEAEAVALGVGRIFLGAEEDVRGFYLKLGYSGRSRLAKTLPGLALARYGQGEDRRRALEDLRRRRAQREAARLEQA